MRRMTREYWAWRLGIVCKKEMDEYSDLDFIIVVKDVFYEQITEERLNIVSQFGKALSAFSGEHVGEPRLIICLYDDPLLHCDFTFVASNESVLGIEKPVILL